MGGLGNLEVCVCVDVVDYVVEGFFVVDDE